MSIREKVQGAIDDVLRPLVEADGGRLELVSIDEDTATVTLRLSGTCAGCPGIHYTRSHVIEPLIEKVAGANVRVVVTRAATLPVAIGPEQTA